MASDETPANFAEHERQAMASGLFAALQLVQRTLAIESARQPPHESHAGPLAPQR